MELFDAITKRHSYREHFKDEEVPVEDLKKIVKAGIQAPSGCNAQTTSFIIVDDPELLKKMSSRLTSKAMASAKAAIVVLYEMREVYHDFSFYKEDYAAAVQNMLLSITALGYASVWLDGTLRLERRRHAIAKLLGVPKHLTVATLLPIGVPSVDVPKKERKPFEERAWFNGYNK